MNKTTAIYPNRVALKQMVESKFGLDEFGSKDTKFYSYMYKSLMAIGYTRIVYGDHGAYFEFNKEQICWDTFKVVREKVGYYDEYRTSDGVKLYWQTVPVTNLPNPPKGKYSVNNNCKEGYADYKVGMAYIGIDHLSLIESGSIMQEKLF